MSKLNRKHCKKLGMPFRFLAGFILLCALLPVVAMVVVHERFTWGFELIDTFLICVLAIYISGTMVTTGYSPGFLLGYHGKRTLTPLPDQLKAAVQTGGGDYAIKIEDDAVTSMEFVVAVLRDYLGLEQDAAVEQMLKIDNDGVAKLLSLEKSVAEKLVETINKESSAWEFPLKVSVEIWS
ncbi:ATP-dependent Clp protease adaptor ClpS [Halioxenophilus sp. WMMB6]|uniref:ATP-dependent Clp protease adaptor ClpS n=1 Tax=Halioxenophilus sp. WMMB6 TaxID=3073815 RepID=UPI00295E68BF|nr:ATP-dependent Clp protease adaptor ClpS [Halioxenophilus sp. WMMB6]